MKLAVSPLIDRARLGRNLRRLRKAAKLSQRELAEPIGLTRQAIAGVEAGTSAPELTTFVGICRKLGCSADVLLRGVI